MDQSIRWWADHSIEVVKIEGKYVALNGWNGYRWTDCWICDEVIGSLAFDVVDQDIIVEFNEVYGTFEFGC